MYTKTEIKTIFNNCRNVAEVIKAAELLKEMFFNDCAVMLDYVQAQSLRTINIMHDDGN